MLILEMTATGWLDLWTKQCSMADKSKQGPSPVFHQLWSCLPQLSEPRSNSKHQCSCVVCTSSSYTTWAHYTSPGLSSALLHCTEIKICTADTVGNHSMKNPNRRIIQELGLAEATCNIAHALDKCPLLLFLWHYSTFLHLYVQSLPLATRKACRDVIAKAHSDHKLRPLHRKCLLEVKRKLKMCIFAFYIEKNHPQHHGICSTSIVEKAGAELSTSYKQLHSSEWQLWNLMTTVPVYHSAGDHIRRAIWVSVFYPL